LVTPTSYRTAVFLNQLRTPFEVFLRIPTFADNNADGLYNNGYSNTYRIFLNDLTSGQEYRINGLVFNYWKRNFLNGTLTPETYFVRFKFQPYNGLLPNFNYPIQSCYVDLTFVGVASTTNGNPRVFWKTCDGISGYISITDRYSLGSIVLTANPGGTVVTGPGGSSGSSA
jgi:hypothetical protein